MWYEGDWSSVGGSVAGDEAVEGEVVEAVERISAYLGKYCVP